MVSNKAIGECSPSEGFPSGGRYTRFQIGFGLAIVIIVPLAIYWNCHFGDWAPLKMVVGMNDVPAIMSGYNKAPSLLTDSLRWWHGTWIQDGIGAFRPISSYQYWIETWIGLHWGFYFVSWIGMALLIAACLLTASLAWRLTRSVACMSLSAVLVPAVRFWNWGGVQPDYWLAWYPVRQDILMICLILGGLLIFDMWLETGASRRLIQSWTLLVCAALTKELAYILPVMYLGLALGSGRLTGVTKKQAFRQVALMMGFVVLLWCYRSLVVPNLHNPPVLRPYSIFKIVILYLLPSYLRYVTSQTYWFVGLAFVLFALFGVLVRLPNSAAGKWLDRPFGFTIAAGAIVAVLWAYCEITYISAPMAFWYLFEVEGGSFRSADLAQMVFSLYAVYLLWKYRAHERTVASAFLFVLAYVPVLTLWGWHHTLTGWFIRCAAYWPMVAKLVWIDVGGWTTKLHYLRQSTVDIQH